MQTADDELAGLEGSAIASTYGNRGMSFEGLIEYANNRYQQTGRAIVTKQHTLCKPLRNGTGQIVSAKYEEKATVDFMGQYAGTPIAFEAKHCAADKIDLKRVEPHQCDFLWDWTAQGNGIGFVLISFQLSDFYLIPWCYWQAAITAREAKQGGSVCFNPMWTDWNTTGKASVRKDELPEEWRVKLGGAAAIDYLATVDRLWRIGR